MGRTDVEEGLAGSEQLQINHFAVVARGATQLKTISVLRLIVGAALRQRAGFDIGIETDWSRGLELRARLVRGLPPYDVPLILLARLAVDRRFSGRGLGHGLISEALRICVRVADQAGCRGITTDAYDGRVSWYAKYGYEPIGAEEEGHSRKMFLDMRTVRAAAGG